MQSISSSFKVIIAGGRNYSNFSELSFVCDFYLKEKIKEKIDIEIVCGCASGADSLGEKYAILKGFKISNFPADWNKHGKSAGYKRNIDMGEYADALIAFWDGESKGTKHMIDIATSFKKMVRIFKYEK